ncbi:MAG TPA: ATP-binding protein [Methylibium sp.]|nr:ATP-binding protein [Methylibium sp.]
MATRAGRTAASADAGELSWFGPIDGEDEADVDGSTAAVDDAAHSRYDRGEWRASDAPDSRFLSRQARRIASAGPSGLQRLYRAFVAARAALSIALLATEALADWAGARARGELTVTLCAVYAFVAVLLWLLPSRAGTVAAGAERLRRRQWLATIGVDVLMFAALQLAAGRGGLGYAALLVLPALMAGALTPRLQALGVAAAGTLVLLTAAWLDRSSGSVAALLLTQAGLAGSGLFVVALLSGDLAGRLAREERTARGSLELARRQAQLNRLVLEEMQDGVMVVDRAGRVRAANPSARALLGEADVSAADSFALTGVAAWQPLVKAIDRAFAEGVWPEGGRDVALAAPATRRLRVRGRFTKRRGANRAEDYCVLFLEDLRDVQARVRQEKLAAMGRVSAGIAHEIRNPLAAIMQANALLAEDATTPQQRQLTQMVTDNAERLKRIVDDVMEVAPGPVPQSAALDAAAQVGAICSDWARTVGLPIGPGSALQVELPTQPLGVVFDGEHLRRVLVNLLDNALRHGSRTPGAVQVQLVATGDTRAVLAVASDGAPIPADTERYLFEPFFSTRSRGTGLGLYICRELCERYGAAIEYRGRGDGARHANEFSVTMRRASLAEGDARLHQIS